MRIAKIPSEVVYQQAWGLDRVLLQGCCLNLHNRKLRKRC